MPFSEKQTVIYIYTLYHTQLVSNKLLLSFFTKYRKQTFRTTLLLPPHRYKMAAPLRIHVALAAHRNVMKP